MTPEPSTGETLGKFATHIRDLRERITAEWIASVRQDARIQSADHLTSQQLRDHMPALFDDLAISLRGADVGGVAAGANEDARTHGHHRWLEKYDVAELLREVAIVRRIFLLSVVPAFAAQNSDFSGEVKEIAKRIIHEFFDNMVTRSVDQYVLDEKAELLRATEELSLANQSLCKANENLERVDQLRLLLTRNVSHEIRNIANAMSGAINVLADQEGDMTKWSQSASAASRTCSNCYINCSTTLRCLRAEKRQPCRFARCAIFATM